MLINQNETVSNELLSPEGLCSLIMREYHPSISESCRKIEGYLLSNQYGKDISIPLSELIHLIFMKLNDEIKHFFLKESGIIFPAIKKNTKGKTGKEVGHFLQPTALESIHQRQQVITNLLQKLRHLLQDYNIQPSWHKDWKECVNEMFQLESKVYQWIHVEGSLLYPKITAQAHH
jgi:iron-sulfur cluster repair protein YtfE (RIC family)